MEVCGDPAGRGSGGRGRQGALLGGAGLQDRGEGAEHEERARRAPVGVAARRRAAGGGMHE